MSTRRVQVTLLCEDNQHDAFFRRYLESAGWTKRQIRVEKAPAGDGAAEQWVRLRYPVEVRALRSKPHIAKLLVVVIDGDNRTPAERVAELDQSLEGEKLEKRSPDEPIIVIVPRRNIETWIAYLRGEDIDEQGAYPKLERERDCGPWVQSLKEMCDKGALRKPVPASLMAACGEVSGRAP